MTQAGCDQKLFFCSSKVDLKVQEYSNTIWYSRISAKQGDTCPQGTEEFRVILVREGCCSVENDLELAVMGRTGVDSGGEIQDRHLTWV